MRRGFAQIFTAVLLIVAVGGHWAILQSLAWAGMLVSYAKTDSVKEAFSKTFDGKHPCVVCKLVKQGSEAEKKSQDAKLTLKLDPWILPTAGFTTGPERHALALMFDSVPVPRFQLPPSPPPRRS